MIIKEHLNQACECLRRAGLESPMREAQLLMCLVTARTIGELIAIDLQDLAPEQEKQFVNFIDRRVKGEPFAYISGKKGFYKSDFVVTPAVLIPRPETEHLVEEVVNWMGANKLRDSLIVDFGTGSGCIGLSLLKEIPNSELVAVDKSSQALGVAKQNADMMSLSERCQFLNEDVNEFDLSRLGTYSLDKDLVGCADVVVANPPYVPQGAKAPVIDQNVAEFEPNIALFSEEDGLKDFYSWSKLAAKLLKSNGLFACEIGKGQGGRALKYLGELGSYKNIRAIKDYSNVDRIVCAERV